MHGTSRRTSPRPRVAAFTRATAAAIGLTSIIGCSGPDDRPFAWAYISPAILQPTCATPSCHSRAVAVAGLDFSDSERGYRSLTALKVFISDPQNVGDGGSCQTAGGTTTCEQPRPLVIAHDPDQSRLVNMLRARGAPRMPPDRPLTEPDIALIEKWILDGARKTPGGPSPMSDAGAGTDARAAIPVDGGAGQ